MPGRVGPGRHREGAAGRGTRQPEVGRPGPEKVLCRRGGGFMRARLVTPRRPLVDDGRRRLGRAVAEKRPGRD